MRVLDHPQDGLPAGQASDLLDEDGQGAVAALLRRERERAVARLAVQIQEGGDDRRGGAHVVHGLGEQHLQPVQAPLRPVLGSEAGRVSQLLDHRIERRIAVIGRALVAQQEVRLDGHCLEQGLGEPRLADPGLARHQDRLTVATLGLLPALQQQGKLLVAADDGRHVARLTRGEAALDGALAQHGEGEDGIGDALEPLRSEIVQLEEVAEELPGHSPDDDRPGLGQRLQPRSQVRRLAHDRVPLRRTLGDEIPHHDHASGDAGARAQRRARGCGQPGRRGRDG